MKLNRLNKELDSINNEKKSLIINGLYDKALSLRLDEMNLRDKIYKLELQLNENKKREIDIKSVVDVIETMTKVPIYELHPDKSKILNEIPKIEISLASLYIFGDVNIPKHS